MKKEPEYTMGYDIIAKVHLKGKTAETLPLNQMGVEHIKTWFEEDMEDAGVDTEVMDFESIHIWKELEEKNE